MSRRTTALPRELLESRGDVSVGAYARRVARRRMLIAGVGLALIVSALALYFALRPTTRSRIDGYEILLRCTACAHEARTQVPFSLSLPTICPKCNQKTFAAVWHCRNCQNRFTPPPTPGPVKCPRCRSTEVGSAAAG